MTFSYRLVYHSSRSFQGFVFLWQNPNNKFWFTYYSINCFLTSTLQTKQFPNMTCRPSKKLSPIMITCEPPLVQPSEGIMAFITGGISIGSSFIFDDVRRPCFELLWTNILDEIPKGFSISGLVAMAIWTKRYGSIPNAILIKVFGNSSKGIYGDVHFKLTD